jgi:DNA-3-methyladenine glycosylase II
VEKALRHLRRADPVLAAIIDRVGRYGIAYLEPDFETLVRSIVFQQLSGKVARVIFERLRNAAVRDGGCMTAECILRLRPVRMRALGVSPQKRDYIRDLARHVRAGSVDFADLPVLSDDEIIEKLTAVRGIGVWTAHMFLIFALRRHDVLPVGDLGIRSAIAKAYALNEPPKPADMERIAECWRPYRSVASWYLWRSLENQAEF